MAGVVLLTAGVMLFGTALGEVDGELTLDGPRLAPAVVAAGWLVIAAVYLVHQVLSVRSDSEPTPDDVDDGSGCRQDEQAAGVDGRAGTMGPQWSTPVLLVGVLIAYILLLNGLGFVISTSLFFVSAARILRSTYPVRDVAIAIPLALAVYLGFTRLLDIHLPEGLLPL